MVSPLLVVVLVLIVLAAAAAEEWCMVLNGAPSLTLV